MKTTTVLLVIIASFGIASWAAEDTAEVKAIQETVANYLEGWFATDPERMSKALHPNLHKCTIKKVPQASTEYLDKYGHLLPSEMTESSAARIRGGFFTVLENHPKLVQRLRRVGR